MKRLSHTYVDVASVIRTERKVKTKIALLVIGALDIVSK